MIDWIDWLIDWLPFSLSVSHSIVKFQSFFFTVAKLESLRATNRYVETLPPANTAHPTASLNGLPGPSSRSPAARSPRIKQEDESYRTVGPQRVNTQPHELSPHRSQTFAGQSGPGLPAALPGRDNFHLLPHLHTPSGSSSQRLTMPESVGGGGGVVSFPLPQWKKSTVSAHEEWYFFSITHAARPFHSSNNTVLSRYVESL